MEPIAHHLVLRLADNRVLPTSTADRRLLARCVLRQGRRTRLLAFRAADTHVHVLLACDRRRTGWFAQSAGTALQQRLRPGARFAPAWHEPVRSQRHLARAFDYVFRQEERHGLVLDPYAEGSNLPDLLGLRVEGVWTTALVRELLPRVGRDELLRLLRLGLPHLSPAPLAPPAHLPIAGLGDAAAAAALLPSLQGSSATIVSARRAAVHAAGPGRTAALARELRSSVAGIKRLRRQPSDPLLVEAVRRQAAIRLPVAPTRLARVS